MSRVVYTSTPKTPWSKLLNPIEIFRALSQHKNLIAIYSKREFEASYRGTVLGLAWTVLNPLIFLTIYTVVFGFVFKMRFNLEIVESKLDFALALFVGLSLYNLLAQSISASTVLMAANSTFVKTLSFPVQILPVAVVINALINLIISLLLISVLFLCTHGFIHWTIIYMIPIIFCFVLGSLGFAWIVAALGVFLRDLPSIVQPILSVMMLLSAIFFPLSAVSGNLLYFIRINPLAILAEEARGCVMYGKIPNLLVVSGFAMVALIFAVLGYAFFMRLKRGFADVL